MHELSIAVHLVRLADEAVRELSPRPTISAVRIRVGDLAGVVAESLDFAWQAARENTACGGARLEIERVPVRIRCATCACEHDLAPPLRFRCPACNEPSREVVAGRELELVALELDETPASVPSRDDDLPAADCTIQETA